MVVETQSCYFGLLLILTFFNRDRQNCTRFQVSEEAFDSQSLNWYSQN